MISAISQYVFDRRWTHLAALWLLQAALAIAMKKLPPLATLHALLTLFVALYIALVKRRTDWIAYSAAYVVGAEVLWRACGASVFWEFAKYTVSTVLLIGLSRLKRPEIPTMALVYALLLVPGAVLSFFSMDLLELRRQISFHLSGPLTLFIAICFFHNMKFNREQLNRMFLSLITAAVGMGSIALFTTASAAEINFGNASKAVTAGGFGPNQVSSVLGLGALLILFFLGSSAAGGTHRTLMWVAAMFLAGQCVLTFSRTGIFSSIIAFLPVLYFWSLDRRYRTRALTLVAVTAAAAIIVLPLLNQFTGGALQTRFEDRDLSGRDTLMSIDFNLWMNNFFYGVGVGVSPRFHIQGLTSHSEPTRMVAEHGLFGFIAALVLVLMATRRFLAARTQFERAFVASMGTWSFLFLAMNGMRLAAASMVLGFIFIRVTDRAPVRYTAQPLPGPFVRQQLPQRI